MISFLSSVLIKNGEDYQSAAVRQQYGMLCGAVGILLNVLLFGGKFFAGILSASIAITADAMNNLSDAGSSFITLIGFKLAGQAPDLRHPFGHGRLEYISGLIVSFLIILMGIELFESSVEKILHPAPVDGSPVVLLILAVSIAVKLYMYAYNRTIGRKIDSAAMKATAMDSLSDTAATAAVLLATLVGQYTGLMIDGWCGLLVALFILWSGINAAKDTISPLLGQPPEEEFVDKIEEIVLSHEGIEGVHDLIVHDYGPGRTMVSLHAEVSAKGDILVLHDTIDNAENDLKEQLHCDAVIHMDPIVTDNPETEQLRQTIEAELHRLDPRLSMHDFRVVEGPTHTNLIFDVVLPYQVNIREEVLVEHLEEFTAAMPCKHYIAVIQVDHTSIL